MFCSEFFGATRANLTHPENALDHNRQDGPDGGFRDFPFFGPNVASRVFRFFNLLKHEFPDLERRQRFTTRIAGCDVPSFRVAGLPHRLQLFCDRFETTTGPSRFPQGAATDRRFEFTFEAPDREFLISEATGILSEHGIHMEDFSSDPAGRRSGTAWRAMRFQIRVPAQKMGVLIVVEQQFRELGQVFFQALD